MYTRHSSLIVYSSSLYSILYLCEIYHSYWDSRVVNTSTPTLLSMSSLYLSHYRGPAIIILNNVAQPLSFSIMLPGRYQSHYCGPSIIILTFVVKPLSFSIMLPSRYQSHYCGPSIIILTFVVKPLLFSLSRPSHYHSHYR